MPHIQVTSIQAATAVLLAAVTLIAPVGGTRAQAPPQASRMTSAEVESAAAQFRSGLERAGQAAGLLESGDQSWRSINRLKIRLEAAEQILHEAQMHFDSAIEKGDVAALDAIAEEVETAHRAFVSIRCSLVLVRPPSADSVISGCGYQLDGDLTAKQREQHRKSLRVQVREWKRRLDGSLKQRGAPPPGSAAARSVNEVRALFDRCLTIADSGSVVQVQAIRSETEAAFGKAGRVLQDRREFGPLSLPSDLRDAAADHLAGRYEKVLALNIQSADSRVRALANLFLASAAYSLYQLNDDAAMRARAVRYVRLSRTHPAIEPDETVFSPRFIVFFESTASR